MTGQGQVGRVLLPGLFLLVFCCLCAILVSLLRLRAPASPLPSPVLATGMGTPVTPTALFEFDFPTFTPFPTATFFVPTPFPTLTPLLPTSMPPPTPTVIATPTSASPVLIVGVDKVAEYAEIRNDSEADPAVLYNARGEEISRYP